MVFVLINASDSPEIIKLRFSQQRFYIKVKKSIFERGYKKMLTEVLLRTAKLFNPLLFSLFPLHLFHCMKYVLSLREDLWKMGVSFLV